jgi:D-glycero-alpha-D-manno-heptose-7-phosphate kinase
MTANLHYVKELGFRSREALEKGDLMAYGRIMDEHWQHKKKRSGGMSNVKIDEWYSQALSHGAAGGKLIGAGGGGFLLFVTEDKAKLRAGLAGSGLEEVRFRFDFQGTAVVTQ